VLPESFWTSVRKRHTGFVFRRWLALGVVFAFCAGCAMSIEGSTWTAVDGGAPIKLAFKAENTFEFRPADKPEPPITGTYSVKDKNIEITITNIVERISAHKIGRRRRRPSQVMERRLHSAAPLLPSSSAITKRLIATMS
jgi:hypothetical protein